MAAQESLLIERIAASSLISRDDLDRCCSDLGNGFDDQRLIETLLRRGLLTKWQITQIQAGRTQNLVLGRYKLLAPLGAGGMGAVFRALDPATGRHVAVKILTGRKATPDAIGRFRREALAALEMHHENVVQAFGLGQQGSNHYLVMELVDGQSLARYLAQKQRLTVRETARIGYEVAQALDHAFRQNIIHRDIKPSNILLSRDGQVKLADLGLAKFFGQESQEGPETRTGQFLGTIDYCSPEQCEDAKRADTRSDIYSLGCTLYHCLAGKPPFGGGTEVQRIMAHLERMPDPIRWSNDDVPAAFAHLIEQQMLAKSPTNRFATPAEAAEALRPWAASENHVQDNLWVGIAGLDSLLAEVGQSPYSPQNVKPVLGAPLLRGDASPQSPFKIARSAVTRRPFARPLIYAVSLLFLLASMAAASRWWTGRNSVISEAPPKSTTDPGFQEVSGQTLSRPSPVPETTEYPSLVYWTDRPAGIRRAASDGSEVTLLIESKQADGLAVDPAAGKIYWTVSETKTPNADRLFRADLDGTHVEQLAGGLPGLGDMVFDADRGQFYLSAILDQKIISLDRDGFGQSLFLANLTLPDELAFDRVARRLYWSSDNTAKIECIVVDGSNRRDVVTGLGGTAFGLAIDSTKGLIYWVNVSKGELVRAKLDGTGQIKLLDGLNKPDGLALDLAAGKLYWTEPDKLWQANLDGSNAKVLVAGKTSEFSSVVVAPAFGDMKPAPSVNAEDE